jgi:hypothetical protein
MNRLQLRVEARREFGGLDQHMLQMLVALLGQRRALRLAGRLALRRARSPHGVPTRSVRVRRPPTPSSAP